MKRFIIFYTLIFGQFVNGAATESETKSLTVSGQRVDTLDISSQEPITNETFRQRIDEQDERNVHAIIARVRHNGNHKIYDAYAFNNLVFGNKRVGTPETNLTDNRFNDPITQERINGIRYFMLQSLTDQNVETIGSFQGMQRNKDRGSFVRHMLQANNPNISPEQRALAQVQVAVDYTRGRGAPLSAEQARYWYNKVMQQDKSERAKAQAAYHLGRAHHYGLGDFEQNVDEAVRLYKQAINQQESIGSREWSRYHLAQLYYSGVNGIYKDTDRGLELFQDLAQNARLTDVKSRAQRALVRYSQDADDKREEAEQAYRDAAGQPSLMEKRKQMAQMYPSVQEIDPSGLREHEQVVTVELSGQTFNVPSHILRTYFSTLRPLITEPMLRKKGEKIGLDHFRELISPDQFKDLIRLSFKADELERKQPSDAAQSLTTVQLAAKEPSAIVDLMMAGLAMGIDEDIFASLALRLINSNAVDNAVEEINKKGLVAQNELKKYLAKYLWLFKNRLSNEFKNTYFDLSLKELAQYRALAYSLFEMGALLSLDLSGNKLTSTDGLLDVVNKLNAQDVQEIDLSNNRLRSINSEAFESLPRLEKVDVSQNPLSDEQIQQLRQSLPQVTIMASEQSQAEQES